MTMRDLMPRPWQPYAGAGLFAASLAGLAAVAPNLVAIACALGGGAALLLFWFTRARFALTVMTLLMLAIAGCALLAAMILRDFSLLPVGVAQIVAILILEGREAQSWVEAAPSFARDRRAAKPIRH